jgi:multidrug resistance efflux pump
MESEATDQTSANQGPKCQPSGLVVSSASRRRVVVLSLLSLAASIGATYWFEHVRYERFSGFLQARYRTVVSVREAQVSEILVTPGTLVMAGQPVVRLKDTEFQHRLESKRREVEALEIQLSQSQAKLEVELEIRRHQILDRIFEAKLKAAQASRKPGQSLAGFAATQKGGWEKSEQTAAARRAKQFDSDRDSVKHASASDSNTSGEATTQTPLSEFDLCAQHIEELERMNRDLPEKISRMMGVDLAQANLDNAQAELTWLESQQRELTLVAENSGMVGVFHKEVGDHVVPYEPIVQLLDEEQPYLVMQIPSSQISDFPPGTLVDLRFPAKATGKGRVVEIPPQTSSIPVDGAGAAETKIAVHVDPIGTLWPNLPFGSSVEVRRRR